MKETSSTPDVKLEDKNKEALNDKIDMEVKSLKGETKVGIEGKYFSEYEVKWALRNTLYTMNMADDTIQALMEKDNVLDDMYKFCSEKKKTDDYYNIVFDYLDKAEHDHLSAILYDRVKSEYEEEIEKIKELSPKEIIENAYKITTLYDIQCVLNPCSTDLSTERLKSLMSLNQPLWTLYHEWKSRDISNEDDIKDVIWDVADSRTFEILEQSFEVDAVNEDEDGLEL